MNLNFQLLRLELFVESDGLNPIHVVLEPGRKGSSSIGWRQLLQQQRCWRHMESVEFRHPVGSCRNYVGIKLESWWIVGQRRFAGLWRWTDWKRWNHPLSQTRESHVLLASSRLYCKGGVGNVKPSSHCSVAGMMIDGIQQLSFQLFDPLVPSVRVERHRSSSVRKPHLQSFEKVGCIDSSGCGWWSWYRVLDDTAIFSKLRIATNLQEIDRSYKLVIFLCKVCSLSSILSCQIGWL